MFRLEGWIRRHIREHFCCGGMAGRGASESYESGDHRATTKSGFRPRGAWRTAAGLCMQTALNKAVLRDIGFLMPSDLAAMSPAEFNRRMRKTARPVVWEDARPDHAADHQ